jgi:pyruvate dehydrogenase E1 component beta subunit
LYFEHKLLYGRKGEIAQLDEVPQLGTTSVVRNGRDLTILASQLMLFYALEAAKTLDDEGISAEVLDARVLRPLDVSGIRDSVARTRRLLIVQEAPALGSWGSSVVAELVNGQHPPYPHQIRMLTGADTPIPYAAELEAAYLPSAARIVAASRSLVRPDA